jgi:predicted enzyme related to lactoylglutathione lyase
MPRRIEPGSTPVNRLWRPIACCSLSPLTTSGGAKLYVFQTSGPGGTPRSEEYTINPTGLDHLSFAVDDVDTTHRELSGRGVEFFMDPVDAEWGARVCGCHDPDGTPVYFLKWNE